MKLFILAATLFFGAQAYAGQVPGTSKEHIVSIGNIFPRKFQPTILTNQDILKKCPADLTNADIATLNVHLDLYGEESNEYGQILFLIVEAERVAKYRAEKNPENHS